MPQVKAGKLKAIGLTAGRSALVPEAPPLANAGVRDFNLEVWTLLGPANLSKAAQARIGRELEVVMKQPEVRQKLFEQGWPGRGHLARRHARARQRRGRDHDQDHLDQGHHLQ